MAFKICPSCAHVWDTRKEFLDDRTLSMLGYQVNWGDLEAGLFLFYHDTPECRTSLALNAGEFKDLHEGPIFTDRPESTSQCSGSCLHESDLDPCRETCECAYVRDVLDKVRHWPKRGDKYGKE